MNVSRFLLSLSFIFLLTQCSETAHKRQEKYTAMTSWERDEVKNPDTVFGGLTFGGKDSQGEKTTGIGVNSFLWRASLDTIAFMPLSQVEPFTGVITTDWYTSPETKNERFKMTVLVLDKVLRADAVKVSVFYEVFEKGKGWVTASVDPDLHDQLEETILARARELRHESNPRS